MRFYCLFIHFADLLLSEDSRESPPRDRFNAVYLVFYLLGMGTLLPWNFFISVNSFWDYKFRDVNATAYHNSSEGYGDDEKERTKLQGWPSKIALLSVSLVFPSPLKIVYIMAGKE